MDRSDIFLMFFLVAVAAMFFFGWRAAKGTSPSFGPARHRGLLSYGKRSEFTEAGWRFRNLAIFAQLLAIVFGFIWLITKTR